MRHFKISSSAPPDAQSWRFDREFGTSPNPVEASSAFPTRDHGYRSKTCMRAAIRAPGLTRNAPEDHDLPWGQLNGMAAGDGRTR
ncbi:MAG: hypothetical protein A3G25_04635 [Betaproteobacteria bacterium RIFCSPLOWO2_12_FULL_63_13]|nr:MAG: hypothetical protein A3H32_10190 [Betaproteobacteria bacterium RIFCSPLOWO2_02_FULL_63_19]OGA45531.1 MAG: hypothetical protein A3G25_04635 [Betaproteobacteria bacterium RIFCSPLOWO2_12_FULL_63_13]